MAGRRPLSKYHESHPYSVTINGEVHSVQYDPGDSTSDMFGGNPNWREPVWIPINFIIIQSIRKLGKFYHNALTAEYPTGSGTELSLFQISSRLSKKVISCLKEIKIETDLFMDRTIGFTTCPKTRHSFYFLNIFTAIRAEVWVLATKRVGAH